MRKYELVLFDADGTLFDYDMAEGIALKKAFEYCDFKYNDIVRNKYREINCCMWKEYEEGKIEKDYLQTGRFRSLLEEFNLNAKADSFNTTYLEFLAECGHLIDGAYEVCKELSEHCTLVIATNGISKTQKKRLKNSIIEPYIKHIIVSEDAGYQKPNQGFFQYAFNTCGYQDKEKTIIVGDSLSTDIKGGTAFGIKTCWYNPINDKVNNGVETNYEIQNLRELIRLIL